MVILLIDLWNPDIEQRYRLWNPWEGWQDQLDPQKCLSLHEANTERITEMWIQSLTFCAGSPEITQDRHSYAAVPNSGRTLKQQKFICYSCDMSILGPNSSSSSPKDLAPPPRMLLGIAHKEKGRRGALHTGSSTNMSLLLIFLG